MSIGVLMVAALVLAAMVRRLRRLRQQARRRREVVAELPYVVDLLGLAVGAGLTVRRAVAAVAGLGSGPVSRALERVDADVADGNRLADRLEQLTGELGREVRPLIAGLVACERYGAPVGETLARLAVDARASDRRRIETAIRRLPVQMVFPLVFCILPAFALLTVAPLLAGALAALRQ